MSDAKKDPIVKPLDNHAMDVEGAKPLDNHAMDDEVAVLKDATGGTATPQDNHAMDEKA
ncbi:hypothetical protein AB0C59_19415 [Streptomyces sp. NPDC048664]|uniref:hypothetical protein n=1 Tax=Streptomyces sp. NPDC048664 TaxID=3154505 RepID=UPI003436EE77